MKHVLLYVGHLYKLFLTKKIWPGWQGGSKKVKIWPRMGLAFIYFWPRSLLEAPKWVKDPGNGLKSIGGTFLGLVVMLSCCNVIMACFNLHLAVCEVSALHTQESKRSAWKTKSCMNIACSSFVRYLKKYKKCMEYRKLPEHYLSSNIFPEAVM